MNNRPGKIYGPAGLVCMTAALILLLLVGGLGVVVTRGRCREVGRNIRTLEAERDKLAKDNRYLEEKMANVTDILNLKKDAYGRLDLPAPGQVVTVRRRSSFQRTVERSVPADPRFTALDIAFINSTPARNTAVR